MRGVILTLLLALVPLLCQALRPSAMRVGTHSSMRPLFSNSFEAMRAAALARKSGGTGIVPPAAAKSAPVAVSPSPVASSPVPLAPVAIHSVASGTSEPRERGSNGGLPFDDELYEHLKFVIFKLTKKIKSEESMTAEELERFRHSISEILADATGKAMTIAPISVATPVQSSAKAPAAKAQAPAPARAAAVAAPAPARAAVAAPVPARAAPAPGSTPAADTAPAARAFKSAPSAGVVPGSGPVPMVGKEVSSKPKTIAAAEDGEEADPNDPFAMLHGMKSTWDVPDSDSMTTEQYYAAINKRNTIIRKKLNDGIGGAQIVDDYMSSLSRKK
ncbi:hypothetical protein B484DRAFT_444480 [Ochromonadaceae sp. CCMP2298]|nr:hypothetical protein B484DRAFT_444480 [Ochromonadaceae sp. CCMP2298]|mmetsp:Transcript_539/g.1324  ORF Transcript_539/g.1324 Transcript_539/m.1324 type:complete len:332 (-) Transcript_539:191-1186(-)